jgi:acyl-CoA synthetase (AMP-forming)/AMP-acid ligase II
MILREFLSRVPADRLAVNDCTVGDLLSAAGKIRQRGFKGARVAIQGQDVARAAALLAALDGNADAILLLPAALNASVAADLAGKAECDAFLTDVNPELHDDDASQSSPDLLGREAMSSHRQNVQTGTTKWILATSGTTGAPKLVAHSLRSLTRTTKIDVDRAADVRWGLLYDHARYAGLQVLLQGLVSGGGITAPANTSDLKQTIRTFAERRCTHVSGTPTVWRKILMLPESELLPLRQVTLGGEIADDVILSALRNRYPQARISHVFASTEAGVGFSVSDGRAGFPIAYLENPPANIRLRVRDDRLFVHNGDVNPSYLSSEDRFADADGFVDTGDVVEIRGDRVIFLGRANGVINVGGNKVHPERVERVLLEHNQVQFARVYAKSNPIVGALVAADVKAAAHVADEAAFKDSVRAFCVGRLEPYETPAFVRVVSELKLSAAGKLERI